MSEEKIKQPRKLVKWIFWRIPITLMVLALVLIVALKIVEGYPDPLRQGFEEYLSEATGRNATIGTLEEIELFPNFIIHAKNITVHNRANAAVVDLDIEDIKINAPFVSVFFRSGKINEFSLTNLKSNKDMLGPKEVSIETANIVVREEGERPGSFVVADGQYGQDKLYFEAQLKAGRYSYEIPSIIPILVQFGGHKVEADFTRKITYVGLENTVFSVNDEVSQPHDYMFAKKREYNQDNPLSCLFTEENLQNCDKYLSIKTEGKEN